MAKENFVLLQGQLRSPVRFSENERGETAMFQLHTLRRNTRDCAGNLEPKWDKPIIATSDPKIIKELKRFKVHDIIEVEGLFRTSNAKKRRVCPHCGQEVIVDMPISTIYPTYADIVDDRLTNDTDGLNYLLRRAEHSNHAKIIGRVCTPTEKIISGETDRGDIYARYQLAVNRKLFVLDSADEEDHTDYPLVYAYNDIAEDNLRTLQQNTLVYLDGYLHTMMYDKISTCPFCHNDFSYRWARMNLTPYSVEYLRDFDELAPSTHSDKDLEPGVEDKEV